MKYYAVSIGYLPGIYNNWEDCKKNVIGFKGAKYKKFNNIIEAQNFINNNNVLDDYFNLTDNNSNMNINENSILNVYTDGSCYGNGNNISYGGYGIYFSQNDNRNLSEPLLGPCTNNIAELKAILKVFEIIDDYIKKGNLVNIYTDSEYSIKCFTNYGDKLYKKDWKSKNNIPNLELIKQGYFFYKSHSNIIKFIHIDAHTEKQDIHSLSNQNADELARLGMMKSIKMSCNLGENVFKKGKYKGFKISQVSEQDFNYLQWYYINNPDKKNTTFAYILKKYIIRNRQILKK